MNMTMNQKIIAKYTDQPDRMPAEVRRAIEGAWGGRPVQLYALTDLDAGMCFTEVWLALGESQVPLPSRLQRNGRSIHSAAAGSRQCARRPVCPGAP